MIKLILFRYLELVKLQANIIFKFLKNNLILKFLNYEQMYVILMTGVFKTITFLAIST